MKTPPTKPPAEFIDLVTKRVLVLFLKEQRDVTPQEVATDMGVDVEEVKAALYEIPEGLEMSHDADDRDRSKPVRFAYGPTRMGLAQLLRASLEST